ncbi:MAG: AsnC family transcriptional regulator [Osedax symbiont Rs2]|nr:MAG: AsnC family transcriptional regulator [Osedax symbiont Rs2]
MTDSVTYSRKPSPYLHDDLDRELVAALKIDGRASISVLAKQLGVSRGTIQNRLDRLLSSGAILGFTLRAHQALEKDMVNAVMMIEVSGRSTSQVIQVLRGIPELVKLHTTNGNWDLLAEIKTDSLSEFDRILGTVRMIPGVLNSETSILLTSI